MHWFAVLTAASTLLLIIVGGLVTSKGVGMAVPDWPNTYGYNMFFFPFSQWVGGIFYEHTHRLVASGVGLLTTILAVWLHGQPARRFLRWAGIVLLALAGATVFAMPARWQDGFVFGMTGLAAISTSFFWPRCEPAPRWMRRLGIIAFVAVVAQGVLGGLRVTRIADQLGIFHGTLAQLFFVLLCAIALFTSRWWLSAPMVSAASPRLNRLFAAATLLILVQLVIGATMRHQHAGLAIPDFPTAYSKLWPDTDPASIERYNQQRLEVIAVKPITRFQVHLQMAHRITACAILAAVTGAAIWAWRRLRPKDLQTRVSLAWTGLILAQVALGAWTIWSGKAADIATAHVLIGVMSLATGAILCILPFRNPVSFAPNRLNRGSSEGWNGASLRSSDRPAGG